MERQLRRRQPGRFPPGPLEAALEGSGLAGRAYRTWRARGGGAGGSRGGCEPTLNARELSEPRPHFQANLRPDDRT